jgi:hypothetical protein
MIVNKILTQTFNKFITKILHNGDLNLDKYKTNIKIFKTLNIIAITKIYKIHHIKIYQINNLYKKKYHSQTRVN